MSNLDKMKNNDLWDRYREAMDALCADPSLPNSRIVDRIEEEIIRRMREAGTKKVSSDAVTV